MLKRAKKGQKKTYNSGANIMSNELTLIIAFVGLIVSLTTIISFVLTRREKGKKEGIEYGELESDIAYIKTAQTNILVSNDKISNKLDTLSEKVIRLEEKYKSIDKRLTKLETSKGD